MVLYNKTMGINHDMTDVYILWPAYVQDAVISKEPLTTHYIFHHFHVQLCNKYLGIKSELDET